MLRTLRFFSVLLLSFLICLPAPSFAETVHYQYDANGNLVSDGDNYFIYNDANKLVQVRSGSATGPVLAEYVYDYTGQRIKKVENGATTYYFGRHYVKQVGGDDPGESFYYFANNRRVARKSGNGEMVYILSDHLAGANVTVDGSGNQIERTRYYPYGNIRSGGEKVRFGYTGKEKDRATDFYYYEARYYNPQFRHFTQPDFVGPTLYNPQSLNRYAYVQNNPLKYVDPDGHFIDIVWDVANVVTGAVSLASNIKDGNWGGAALDAGGLLLDVAAAVVPGVPGGAGTALKAMRAVDKGVDAIKGIDKAIDSGKAVRKTADSGKKIFKQVTVLGENMKERVIPFAKKTDSRTLPFGTTKGKWDSMTPKQRWKLNDGSLRSRIKEGDDFRYIGRDAFRDPAERMRFDLTKSELLRLEERGIVYDVVSYEEVLKVLGRP